MHTYVAKIRNHSHVPSQLLIQSLKDIMWWNLSLAIVTQVWDQFEIITADCHSSSSDLRFPPSFQSTSLLPSDSAAIFPCTIYIFFSLHCFSFPKCLMVDLARNPVRRREGWRLLVGHEGGKIPVSFSGFAIKSYRTSDSCISARRQRNVETERKKP